MSEKFGLQIINPWDIYQNSCDLSLWINTNGLILKSGSQSTLLKNLFQPGTMLSDHLSGNDQLLLSKAMDSITLGALAETISLKILENSYHVSIYPEKNSKRITGFRIMASSHGNTDDVSPEIPQIADILFTIFKTSRNIWIDAFRLDNLNYILWNAGAEQMSGYSADEVINGGLTWGWLYPETEYRLINWRFINDFSEDRPFKEMITRIKTRRGQEKVIGWTSQVVYSGGEPRFIINVGSDLTREVNYKNALRSSGEEYRALADNSPDLIVRFDQSFKCTYTNASTISYNPFGISRKLLGKSPSQGLSDSVTAKDLEDKIQSTFQDSKPQRFEMTVDDNCGYRVFEVHMVPEISPEEIIRSVLVIARDISLRRKHEYRIRTAERFEAAGRVACELAHNINNQLTVLSGKLDILKHRLTKKQDATDLVNDLLALTTEASKEIRSSLDLGQSPEHNELIECSLLLENIVKDLRPTASDVDFILQTFSDRSWVQGSEKNLKNVFINIISNALDSMNYKGILRIKLTRTKLYEKQDTDWNLPSGDYLQIDFTDTGSGIPAEIQTKIFDPLFTTKSAKNGTGMGLAIAYSTIKSMGGIIDFTTQINHGTRFSILLPESREQGLATSQIASSNNEPIPGAMHILWVDDNPIVLDVAVELVETFNYTASAASNGFDAIEIYKNQQAEIDLIVLDVHMPGIDGWTTFRKLREINPDVKVIICTGKGFSREAEKIMQNGAYAILMKPFAADDLFRVFKDVTDS